MNNKHNLLLTFIILPILVCTTSRVYAEADCDRLAASSFDQTRPKEIKGASLSNMDGAAAMTACQAALANDPGNARIKFQLARTFYKTKQPSESYLKLFREAADQGSSASMHALGIFYQTGTAVPKDESTAVNWYRKAIGADSVKAMTNIGQMYQAGSGGLTMSDQQSTIWYQKAAAAGDSEAMRLYANSLLLGRGIAKDEVEAVHWYHQAADAADSAAMSLLGLMTAEGQGGLTKDPLEATRWFQKAAYAGDTDGMLYLADAYNEGSGVAKDDWQARKWYQRAAELGNANAMVKLGHKLDNNGSTKENLEEANAWFRKAANLGDKDGTIYLASNLVNGRGIKRDLSEAVTWLKKGSDAEDARAAFKLGLLYEIGLEVPKDLSIARNYYNKAADFGDDSAMIIAGIMSEYGEGGLVDVPAARRRFESAAKANNSLGMNNLGVLYASGKGGVQDLVEAARWFQKAKNAGSDYATSNGVKLQQVQNEKPTAAVCMDALKVSREIVKTSTKNKSAENKNIRVVEKDSPRSLHALACYRMALEGDMRLTFAYIDESRIGKPKSDMFSKYYEEEQLDPKQTISCWCEKVLR